MLFEAESFFEINNLPKYIIGNLALVSYEVISDNSSTKSRNDIFNVISLL